jgi:hypothetical protein
MASIFTCNVTLSKEMSGYIEGCDSDVGAYMIMIKPEKQSGSTAIFHIGSGNNGEKRIKRHLSLPGSNGEQLSIVWPDNLPPILCYESDESAPEEKMHYNLKIV